MVVFWESREIAANTSEDCSALRAAKTARNLLLGLCHPDVAFAQIVVERDERIGQECQHILFELLQTIKQILRFRLLWATSLFLLTDRCGGRKILSEARLDQSIVSKINRLALDRILCQTILGQRLARCFCFQQKIDQ